MIRRWDMLRKNSLLYVSLGCVLVNAMTFSSNVLGSEIESNAQVSFQMPDCIPIQQQQINKIEQGQGFLVNAPVANGEYDRQFGYVSTRKEVMPALTRLPSVGITHTQSLSYILCSAIIITMMITLENRKREEL